MNGGRPDSGIDVVFFLLATCFGPWREEGNAPCGRTDATDADALSDGWTAGKISLVDRPPSSLAGANGEQSALTPRTARGLFLVCMSLALRSLLKNCLGVQNIVQKV